MSACYDEPVFLTPLLALCSSGTAWVRMHHDRNVFWTQAPVDKDPTAEARPAAATLTVPLPRHLRPVSGPTVAAEVTWAKAQVLKLAALLLSLLLLASRAQNCAGRLFFP